MKKIILLVLVATAVNSLHAQIKLGGRAGVNLARFKAPGAGISTEARAGIDGALLAEFAIAPKFSIQPEIGYSTYGMQAESNGDKATYNLSYIVVPVLAKFNTAEGLSVMAGPQVGINTSAKGKLADDEEQDIQDFINPTDIFAVVGVEYNFKMGIFLSARYTHGLTDISKQGEVKIYNRSAMLSVGYKITLK